MRNFFFISISFGFLACIEPQKQSDFKNLDLGLFTISAPASWKKIKENGTDSYVGRIAIDNGDTLDFDLGLYSDNLYEYDPQIMDSSFIGSFDTSRINPNDIVDS